MQRQTALSHQISDFLKSVFFCFLAEFLTLKKNCRDSEETETFPGSQQHVHKLSLGCLSIVAVSLALD